MINFNKNSVWNLRPINVNEVRNELYGLLLNDEVILSAFKTIRDQLVLQTSALSQSTCRESPDQSALFPPCLTPKFSFCHPNTKRYGNGQGFRVVP